MKEKGTRNFISGEIEEMVYFLLRKNKVISVTSLAHEMKMSNFTAYYFLNKFEKEGKILRIDLHSRIKVYRSIE